MSRHYLPSLESRYEVVIGFDRQDLPGRSVTVGNMEFGPDPLASGFFLQVRDETERAVSLVYNGQPITLDGLGAMPTAQIKELALRFAPLDAVEAALAACAREAEGLEEPNRLVDHRPQRTAGVTLGGDVAARLGPFDGTAWGVVAYLDSAGKLDVCTAEPAAAIFDPARLEETRVQLITDRAQEAIAGPFSAAVAELVSQHGDLALYRTPFLARRQFNGREPCVAWKRAGASTYESMGPLALYLRWLEEHPETDHLLAGPFSNAGAADTDLAKPDVVFVQPEHVIDQLSLIYVVEQKGQALVTTAVSRTAADVSDLQAIAVFPTLALADAHIERRQPRTAQAPSVGSVADVLSGVTKRYGPDPEIFAAAEALAATGHRVAIVIPTNQERRTNGNGIMGAGLARQARDLAKVHELDLERRLGLVEQTPAFLARKALEPYLAYDVIAFDTKFKWQQEADLKLIGAQAEALIGVLERDAKALKEDVVVLIPRVGAGEGRLEWADVKAELQRHLKGEQFVFLDDYPERKRSKEQTREATPVPAGVTLQANSMKPSTRERAHAESIVGAQAREALEIYTRESREGLLDHSGAVELMLRAVLAERAPQHSDLETLYAIGERARRERSRLEALGQAGPAVLVAAVQTGVIAALMRDDQESVRVAAPDTATMIVEDLVEGLDRPREQVQQVAPDHAGDERSAALDASLLAALWAHVPSRANPDTVARIREHARDARERREQQGERGAALTRGALEEGIETALALDKDAFLDGTAHEAISSIARDVLSNIRPARPQVEQTAPLGGKGALQCHSRGYIEQIDGVNVPIFSPFGVAIEYGGRVDSIENVYHRSKVFELPEGFVRPRDWEESRTFAKAHRQVGWDFENGFVPMKHEAIRAVDEPGVQFYVRLWQAFLETPDGQRRIEIAKGYDTFVDPFEGTFPYGQAKVMEAASRGGPEALTPVIGDVLGSMTQIRVPAQRGALMASLRRLERERPLVSGVVNLPARAAASQTLDVDYKSRAYYTGVGSRETPPAVQTEMTEYAARLEALGMVLRSGAADGSDVAFERGVMEPQNKEIYLPFDGFTGGAFQAGHDQAKPKRSAEEEGVHLVPANLRARAEELASAVHPNWPAVLNSRFARAAHTRNAFQVLGADLATPSSFLICWAPVKGSSIDGGTRTAYELAKKNGIPTYNLAVERDRKLFVARLEAMERSAAAGLPLDAQAAELGASIPVTPEAQPTLPFHPAGLSASNGLADEAQAIESLPPAAPDTVRLYRAESSRPTADVADWIRESPEYQAQSRAAGRWFTASLDDLDFYRRDSSYPGFPARVKYVDLPIEQADALLVANVATDDRAVNPRSFSGRPESEYFLSNELATSAIVINEARRPAATLSRELVREIAALTRAIQTEQRKLEVCDEVASQIEERYGWPRVFGLYVGPEITEAHPHYHNWNVLPDGRLLDATANQFGHDYPVRLVKPGDQHAESYLAELQRDGKRSATFASISGWTRSALPERASGEVDEFARSLPIYHPGRENVVFDVNARVQGRMTILGLARDGCRVLARGEDEKLYSLSVDRFEKPPREGGVYDVRGRVAVQEAQRATPAIPGLRIVRNYLDPAAQAALVSQIDERPWNTELKRRTQHYGWKYSYDRAPIDERAYIGALPAPLYDVSRPLGGNLHEQAIVNEYQRGQGIGAHVDHPSNFGETIASVSLLAPATMTFKRGNERVDVVLRPGDLLLMTDEARTRWTHQIDSHDARRLSVTFRSIRDRELVARVAPKRAVQEQGAVQADRGRKIIVRVGNVNQTKDGIYVGRTASVGAAVGIHLRALGNWFIVGKHGNRGECAKLFADDFPTQLAKPDRKELEEAMQVIEKTAIEKGEVQILCHCDPQACHGHGIADVAIARLRARGYDAERGPARSAARPKDTTALLEEAKAALRERGFREVREIKGPWRRLSGEVVRADEQVAFVEVGGGCFRRVEQPEVPLQEGEQVSLSRSRDGEEVLRESPALESDLKAASLGR